MIRFYGHAQSVPEPMRSIAREHVGIAEQGPAHAHEDDVRQRLLVALLRPPADEGQRS